MVGVKGGRADCLGFEASKLSVVQSGQDWRVAMADTAGYTVALLASKDDADATVTVIQKKNYTAVRTIGKGSRTFRYFESAR